MKIRMAAKNLVTGCRTFYVQSDSDPTLEYMVLEIKRNGQEHFFCNCGDFFGRKLPFFGTNQFSLCKHAAEVREATKK